MTNTIEIATTAKIHHATRAKAEKLATLLAAEYPLIAIAPTYDEDESRVIGWITTHTTPEGEETILIEGDKVPDLADIFEACDEHDIDPEEGADEEQTGGSVVPEEYRAMYRENSSNGQTCGDWLAEWLVSQTHGVEGFHVEEFRAILSANAVDMTRPWAGLYESGQPGWIGRYRMNGRQVLEKTVAKTGSVNDARGNTYPVPEGDLAILRNKHAKWLAKEAKREAAEAAKAA